MATLYHNGVVLGGAAGTSAFVVAGPRLVWLGRQDQVHQVSDGVERAVDLAGVVVTPGFVDSHVHVLETGFALADVDLSRTTSRVAALAEIRQAGIGGGPVLAYGWDESRWTPAVPLTGPELDRAVPGLEVYALRADLHSAVVSSPLADRAGARDVPGWAGDGLVTDEAHARSRATVRDLTPSQRDRLCRQALAAFAARGLVAVHEQSVPELDTRAGLAALVAGSPELPAVVGYRAELCETAAGVRAIAAEVPGLVGVGGDLCVDGSLGSRTAALREPYRDGVGSGRRYLAAEQIANHISAATQAGLQAALHVIGDAAMDEVLLGLQVAGEVEGAALRAAGHRLEHAEMTDAYAAARILLFGLTLSVQPAFDASWGGSDGMYAQRLGPGRAALLNPWADLHEMGIPLAFGSDSPVTPADPWLAVRAAVNHHEPGQRLPLATALHCHGRAGWLAAGAGQDGAGELRTGAPASLAFWDLGSAAVADLMAGDATAVCVRAMRDGVVIHDTPRADTPRLTQSEHNPDDLRIRL